MKLEPITIDELILLGDCNFYGQTHIDKSLIPLKLNDQNLFYFCTTDLCWEHIHLIARIKYGLPFRKTLNTYFPQLYIQMS